MNLRGVRKEGTESEMPYTRKEHGNHQTSIWSRDGDTAPAPRNFIS
jgi:hypothetical protein